MPPTYRARIATAKFHQLATASYQLLVTASGVSPSVQTKVLFEGF